MKRNKTIQIQLVIVLMIGVSMFSCKKDKFPPTKAINDDAITETVYVAGSIDGTPNRRACVWKNGAISYLTDGEYTGSAIRMELYNNDVYILGSELLSSTKSVAKLWKNGVPTNLNDGSTMMIPADFCISNNDIYVVVNEIVGSANTPKLFKNSTLIYTFDASEITMAYSVSVVGADIYVSGVKGTQGVICKKEGIDSFSPIIAAGFDMVRQLCVINNDFYFLGKNGNTMKYGINGFLNNINLTDGTSLVYPRRMAIVNNDVYVVGDVKNTMNVYVSKLWKNGTEKVLSDGIFESNVMDVYYHNSSLYIIYNENGKAIYLKNDTKTELGDNAVGNSIRVN